MPITTIQVVQPSELSADFTFDTQSKKWVLATKPVKVSTDAGNAITNGTDGGTFLAQSKFKSITMVQDNAAAKLYLYEYPAGTTFNQGTATLLQTVDMVALNAKLDEVDISGTVVTFKDTTTNKTMNLDVSTLLTQIAVANSNAVNLSGNGTSASPLTVSLVMDPNSNNILKMSATGLMVSRADVLAIAQSAIPATTVTAAHDAANQKLNITVNGVTSSINTAQLTNSSGTVLGNLIL